MIEELTETTVRSINGVSVAAGNIGLNDFELPDGTLKEGMAAVLFFPDDSEVVVGAGSVVEIGGAKWEVTHVHKQRGELGTVTLKQLE